jgi:uncharacterized protein (DUF427 family)
VRYIPLDDVVPGRLRPSASHTYCPYKGDASYYDIVLPDGTELADAVWTYPSPYPAVEAIAGRVAFYPDRVKVTAATSSPAVSGTEEVGTDERATRPGAKRAEPKAGGG